MSDPTVVEGDGCIHTLKDAYRKHSVDEMLRLLKEYMGFHKKV